MLPPKSVLYIGCVGKDKYADILREACDKAGLRVEYRIDEKEPTGRCGVIITGHNRSMCTHLAAANEYKLEHLKSPEIWKLVEQAKMYYVGGYHLTVCPPAIMALAEEAVKENKPFIIGMGAPFVPRFFKEQMDATEPYWDYFLGNETEVRTWAEVHGHETQDVKEIARVMAELPKKNEKRKRVVIVTQGTEETVVAIQGEQGVKTYPVREIGKNEINDTTGAG
jgi:adenosine kinase